MTTPKKLSQHFCENVVPESKARKYFDGGGLYLHVSPTGSKHWRHTFRIADKAQTLSIGRFPIISIDEARRRHALAVAGILKGDVPHFHLAAITKEADLTHASLCEALHYEPETGLFSWRFDGKHVKAGDPAGSSTGRGYWKLRLNGVDVSAHRLAWFYVHGVWPVQKIDHINRVKSDNRIKNLRDVSAKINSHNVTVKSKRIGLQGVMRDEAGHFHATIRFEGCQLVSSRLKSPAEAHLLYLKLKEKIHEGFVAA